jgi:hypothetical protein
MTCNTSDQVTATQNSGGVDASRQVMECGARLLTDRTLGDVNMQVNPQQCPTLAVRQSVTLTTSPGACLQDHHTRLPHLRQRTRGFDPGLHGTLASTQNT